MNYVDLDQLRALVAAGSVLSVTLEAVGKNFALKAKTHRGDAVLVPVKSPDSPRLFADLRRALLVLNDLGIREAVVDTAKWEPKQQELGTQRLKQTAPAKKAPAAKKPARKATKKA